MLVHTRADVLAKIAAGTARRFAKRQRRGSAARGGESLARARGGEGKDGPCRTSCASCGPSDRAFEEMHTQQLDRRRVCRARSSIARASGRHVMSAGRFSSATWRQLRVRPRARGRRLDASPSTTRPNTSNGLLRIAGRNTRPRFGATRFAPARELSGVVARTRVALSDRSESLERARGSLSAARALSFDGQRTARFVHTPRWPVPSRIRSARSRWTRRSIASLRMASGRNGLSPFAYLRTFERLTGATPHQLSPEPAPRAAVRFERNREGHRCRVLVRIWRCLKFQQGVFARSSV
jgi:hypothetical protein